MAFQVLNQPFAGWRYALAALFGALAFGMSTSLPAQTAPQKPIYWQQRFLFVPYQPNALDPKVARITQVQLLLSRSGEADWQVLQTAQSNVQGFSYQAAEDGEYWLAVRHLDAAGQIIGPATPAAQLHMVIDTAKPSLQLSTQIEPDGGVTIRYDARDTNLQPDSLILEARNPQGLWETLAVAPEGNDTRETQVGQARFAAAARDGLVEIRGSVSDRAGHRTEATASVEFPGNSPPSGVPANPAMTGPVALPAVNLPPSQTPQNPAAQQRLAQDWPTSNKLPSAGHGQGNDPAVSHNTAVQAIRNPYLTASTATTAPELLQVPGPNSQQPQEVQSLPRGGWPLASPQSSTWNSAEGSTGDRLRVNSRTFDLEYELQSVGPGGVAKVELWGTQDGGATWRSFATDADFRSPIRVTVPEAGEYGFSILVEGANGLGAAPPREGDRPELVVDVDLQPPSARLRGVRPVPPQTQ